MKSFLPAVILAVRAFPAGVLGNAAVRHIHLALRYLEESGGSVISGGVATSVSLVRVLLAIGVYFHVGLLFQCGGGYMPATDIVPSNALECEFLNIENLGVIDDEKYIAVTEPVVLVNVCGCRAAVFVGVVDIERICLASAVMVADGCSHGI